jgi:preprotein translocase subunit SecF
MIRILKETKFNFTSLRFAAYLLSAVFIILGLAGIVQLIRGKANVGIDFSGGSVVMIKSEKDLDIEKMRNSLVETGLKDTSIQHLKDEAKSGYRYKLRIKQSNVTKTGTIGEYVLNALTKTFPDAKIINEGVRDTGPAVSKKIQNQAFWAVFFAMIGITVYIWLRFDFKFGIAAAAATLHDVLFMIAVIFITGREFSLLIVTALLTIAGYSLTDTVVVFDRIRENLRIRVKDSFNDIINLSINEVLNRTIMTSFTTLMAVVALLIWGGEVINDFCFTLLVGIIVGTYSSWFVASPMLLEWEKMLKKNNLNK